MSKDKKRPSGHQVLESESAKRELAELGLEGLKQNFLPEWFEDREYISRLRERFYTNLEQYHEQFSRGYDALLEELAEWQKEQSSTDR